MQQISAEYVQAFSRQIEALNKSAGRVLVTEDSKRNLTKRLMDGEADAYDELMSLMRSVCGSYNRLSASLTCNFYNGIRQAANQQTEFSALPYDRYDEERLEAKVAKCVDDVAQGRNTVPLVNLLTNVTSEELKMASDRTTRNNAIRDPGKPMFCIVPNVGACAFCQMRASLGYQYADRSSIESHNHCTCVAVQVYKGQKVQGYNPQEYLDKYNKAKEAYENGDIPKELQERISNQKDDKGSDFRKTNAVLMVMRYQQGIS